MDSRYLVDCVSDFQLLQELMTRRAREGWRLVAVTKSARSGFSCQLLEDFELFWEKQEWSN